MEGSQGDPTHHQEIDFDKVEISIYDEMVACEDYPKFNRVLPSALVYRYISVLCKNVFLNQ